MSKGGILVIVALSCVAAVAALWASAGNAVWSISVVGLKGEALGTLTLELTNESARTCMSGDWKKARVIQSSFQPLATQLETKDYFPTYEEDGDGLIDFYGGYGIEVRLRSVLRFAEIWAYAGVFHLLRRVTNRASWGPRASLVQ